MLAGKVALVTGATSGIGWETTRQLAAAGARVVAAGRRAGRLDALVEQVEAAGGQAYAVVCDLREDASIHRLFEQIDSHCGRLDILVNNAGLAKKASFLGGDLAEAQEHRRIMWQVNVLALCSCTALALRRFDPDAGGHVVNVSSMAGHRVPPGGGFYSATKHAVKALTEALRQELRAAKSKTRVAAISPGYVETEFFEVLCGSKEAARDVVPKIHILEAVDIARQVLHVVSQPAHVQIHDVLMRATDQVG